MSKDIIDGWNYISAIFKMMTNNCVDIFEPHYVYRGITKRYFSDSQNIAEHLEEINKRSDDKTEIQITKERVKKFYMEDVYLHWMLTWILLENPELKNKDLFKQQIKDNIFLKGYTLKDDVVDSAFNKFDELNKEELDKYRNSKDLSILESINKDYYDFFIPEYIESGLAVRLQEFQEKNENIVNKHIDYINYIDSMIKDLKTRFPKYVDENYTDLEILADIQHKGAASCLVDFSSNLLTSLWFATNSDYKDFGFLFCYDINNDVLVRDKLTILDTQRHDEKSINDLLYETTKTTTYSGKREYKFWLWRPSNLNERIARQDSVFVFGLEKFIVKDHSMRVIPIPPSWKKPIQHTLKTFFGVTGESIYCDIDGYADSNSKTSPYEKTVFSYFPTSNEEEKTKRDNLQNGMSCLFECEYESALQYFIIYEQMIKEKSLKEFTKSDSINEEELRIFVELHYSKAICLKNMNNLYRATGEYKLIVDESDVVLKNLKEGHTYNYLKNKYIKSINDLIDIYYDTKQYDLIKKLLCKIKEMYGNDKDDLKHNFECLEITTTNEILCLTAMEKYIQTKSKDKEVIYLKDYKDLEKSQPLYYALNLYFCCILESLNIEYKDNKDNNNDIKLFKSFINDKGRVSELLKKPKVYNSWNLKDIKRTIIYVQDREKYLILKELTSMMEDFVDFCNGLSEINPY